MIPTLLAALEAHAAEDEAEAGHRAEMLELLGRGADSFSRAHFGPGHFTASCYIVDADDRLLLHHHRRLDRWLQMGGHIEPGESPLEAALREGREESGLTDLVPIGGLLDLDIHPIPAGKGEPDHRHFDVRYLARTASAGSIMMDQSESNDLRWVTLEEAATLMPAGESLRVLRKIARLLGARSRSLPEPES
jgi:8-oxo-dGTP pyrophosphatase MutT (NUDIX family)